MRSETLTEPMDEDEDEGEHGAQRRVVEDTEDEESLFNGFNGYSEAEDRNSGACGALDPR